MRSFGFSTLATLACAAFSFAAPLEAVAVAGAKAVIAREYPNGPHHHHHGIEAGVAAGAKVDVRDYTKSGNYDLGGYQTGGYKTGGYKTVPGNTKDVQTIIVDLTVDVTLIVQPLLFITKDNCTVEYVTPVVEELKAVLTIAIGNLNIIVGGLVGGVLTLVGITVAELAGLIFVLLKIIFAALACVLKVVGAADKAVIVALLCEVAKLVAVLLKIILGVVGGLLVVLLPLVGGILKVCVDLGVIDIFAVIGLKL